MIGKYFTGSRCFGSIVLIVSNTHDTGMRQDYNVFRLIGIYTTHLKNLDILTNSKPPFHRLNYQSLLVLSVNASSYNFLIPS